jgi:PAS domain S-box-containing protein
MKKNTPSNIINPQSLRVLMVEDSEDDALLIIRELKKGGYNPVYERMETAAAMKKALKEKQWDIILCDYKMPKFSGKQAIAQLKETNIDIPLIIVSGTVGEETAIECMRSGAHDYVMKDSLSRLCPAIARELEEAKVRNKQRQAENALRQSEEKYRTILDEMADVYFEVDLAGNFTFFNDAIYHQVGYSREELIGTSFRCRVAKEDIATLYNTFGKIYSTGKPERSIFYKFMRKDGTMGFVEAAVFPLQNQKGEIVGFRGIVRDITERKRSEEALRESERKYKSLIDNFQDIILTINLEGKITFASQSIKEKLGYESAETINMSILDFVPEEDHQRVLESLQKGMKGEKIKGFQTQVITKSGERLFFEGSFSRVYKDGAVVGAQAIIKDITESKRAAEEVLREKHFSDAVIDSLPGIFYLIDKKGQFARFNKNMADVTGFSVHELSLLSATDVIKKEDRKLIKIKIEEAFNNGHTVAEASILTKDGREFPYYFTAISIAIEDNIFIVGMGIDITERKKMEETLRQSEERYRTILDEMADAYFEVDIAGNYTFVNDAICHHLGYSREELIGTSFRDQMVKEELAKVYKAFGKIYITGKPERDIFYKLLRKDGTTSFAEMTGFSLKNQQGEVIGFRGVGRDVSERKKMEEDLRRSEEKYRTILENIEDGYYEVDFTGNFTFFNDSMCRILGYPQEEMMGMNNRQFTDKENAKKLFKTFNEVYRTGQPAKEFDWQVIRKDGTKRYIEVSVSLQKDSSGKPIGFQGIARDVSERKQTDESLRESEALYHLLAEHMTDIVWMMNMDLNVTWVSPSAMKARGFSWDEIAALPLDRQLTPESLRKAVNWLGKLMRLEKDGRISETDGILSRELEFYCKDGHTIVLDCIFQFIRDEQGKATGILAEGRDITARKRVEEELKQSFERLRKALGATVQSISTIVEMKDPYTAGHQQRVSDLARSIATEMGLSADQQDFIRTASAIHDIGKISIPAEILSKPTKLTDLEFNLIKTHSQSGHDILKDIEFPWPVADVVLQHHERMDGSGYPQGLKGNDILLEARIMAVADVVEAIASHRPYRPSLGIDFALDDITRNKGILYDADVVDACLKLFREKGYTLVFKKS